MTEQPHACHDMSRVSAALTASLQTRKVPASDPGELIGGWLDDAERLLLDGRADVPSLVRLILAAEGPGLSLLERHPPGRASTMCSVLQGWREAGLPGSGMPAVETPGGWDVDGWGCAPPDPQLVVAAAFHAAAADRLAWEPSHVVRWAACGLIDVWNAPDPPDVADPTIGDSCQELMLNPEDDQHYRILASWTTEVGPEQAPRWFSVGYSWDEAAFLLSLPDGDHRKPNARELALRTMPRDVRVETHQR